MDCINLAPAEVGGAVKGTGVPDALAELLADSDAGAAKGGLFDDSRSLSQLIGRPTTPFAEVIKATLAK